MPKGMNNPAARLKVVVDKARSISRDNRTVDAWAVLVETEANDIEGILLGISNLIQLAVETKQAVENLEGHDQNLYLQPVVKILSLFTNIQFGASWASTVDQIDQVTLYGLSACSDVLSRYSQEKPIEDETIEKMVADVQTLQKEVLESNLPQELKAFLSTQLEKLRRALLQYNLFGTQRLETALEGIAGAVIFHAPKVAPSWNHPVVKKIWDMLTNLATLITMAQGYQMISDGITKLLSAGKP